MECVTLEFDDNRRLTELCGPLDLHLAAIEGRLGVQIAHRGSLLEVCGADDAAVAHAAEVIAALDERLRAGRPVGPDDVDGALRMSEAAAQPELFADGPIEIMTRRKRVEPRTPGQAAYVRAMARHPLVFGVGPAGTGKTYLAVAMGVSLILQRKVSKLILSRPAVEAGERLGFLPGDMNEKIDPYLQPLYDAIKDLWNSDHKKLIAENKLEVAPLAFMRGRTLQDAFIVLDEAQNATEMQMKMFLTRLGENSRMVVTGDVSQVDLPRGVRSGLRQAVGLLEGVEGVGVQRFQAADVVRHPLVARIIRAYDADDAEGRDHDRGGDRGGYGRGGRERARPDRGGGGRPAGPDDRAGDDRAGDDRAGDEEAGA